MTEPGVLGARLVDGLLHLTLNRPDAMNALNLELKQALAEQLARARYDDGVRAVLLTGNGKAFCAGGDLKEMDPDRPAQAARMRQDQLLRTLFLPLARLPVPTVAAVHGHAHGAGLSLALACDVVLAADGAPMSLGFVHRGLSPDCGIAYFLPRLVGSGRAKELLLTGRRFDAEEAHRMGLVSEVMAADTLLQRASDLAQGLAAGPTIALGYAKSLVDQAWNTDLEQFAELESHSQAVTRTSADHREGIAAFLGKRTPTFSGR
jgi:2-(1,2-epoxy-1,2-dihydrophenyl)acetyl-CoA isomerase